MAARGATMKVYRERPHDPPVTDDSLTWRRFIGMVLVTALILAIILLTDGTPR